MSGTFFPDVDLVNFVLAMYGPDMAASVEEMFNLDPDNEAGFARSVRRSLTREIETPASRLREDRIATSMAQERYYALHGSTRGMKSRA